MYFEFKLMVHIFLTQEVVQHFISKTSSINNEFMQSRNTDITLKSCQHTNLYIIKIAVKIYFCIKINRTTCTTGNDNKYTCIYLGNILNIIMLDERMFEGLKYIPHLADSYP